MKSLYINGEYIDKVQEYHQDRRNMAWIFFCRFTTKIVKFDAIKTFTSADRLEITTF